MAPAAGSTSSTSRSEAAARRGDDVRLGWVVGVHGLRGELRVQAEGSDVSGLLQVPKVRLARAGEEGEDKSESFEIVNARPGRAGECRLQLRGVYDRDAAEAWRGARVLARPADLPRLSPGEFYAFELVGCRVSCTDGREIGRVREIWETGANDVLVIEDATGRDQLVPAVEPLLVEVDVAERRIVVDAPPGLLSLDGGEEDEEDEG